jgi:hypothetical protein
VFEIDEDDMLIGSPRSKFFDMLLNANRDLVENVLEKHIDRFVAMEILLQEVLKDEFENAVNQTVYERSNAVEEGKNDFFIGFVGDILSQHE